MLFANDAGQVHAQLSINHWQLISPLQFFFETTYIIVINGGRGIGRGELGCVGFPGLQDAEDDKRARQDDNRRDNINKPVETGARGFGQDTVTILLDEIVFDLLFRPAFGKALADEFPPLGTGLCGAYVEGDVFAHRTVHVFGDGIDFIVGDDGGRLLGNGGGGEEEGEDERQEDEA